MASASAALLMATAAAAVTPTVIWQRTGIRTGLDAASFSADGTVVLLSLDTGFEVRRASDGVLLNTVTLPSGSRGYAEATLAPSKAEIALALFQAGSGRIEIWSVQTSTLIRVITTDNTRTFKTIAYSSNGLVATQERFAYGSGGFLRVHNASTGALLAKIGPTVRNSSPITIGFSPNGQFLAGSEQSSASLKVYRTSNWTTALTFGAGTFAGLLSWSPDGASLWTNGYQQVRVPDGAVLQTLQPGNTQVTSIAPNNQSALASAFVNGQYSNVIEFLRVPDGAPRVVYTLAGGTVVYSSQINATATRFTYEICPNSCTVFVAQMPAL